MAENVENRRTTEKLMLARGVSWRYIKETLELTDKQYYDDKEAIENELKENLTNQKPEEYFENYKTIAQQVIEDLQLAAETADSTAGRVSALRGKEATAKSIIDVGQSMGIIDKKAQVNETFGVHKIDVNITDKSGLVETLTAILGGSRPTTDKNDVGETDS